MSGSDLDGALQTTEDVFLGGRLRLRQPARGYRAGLDAVLLAATILPDQDEGPILDLGAGVGTVGLCVATRCSGAHVVLIERAKALLELARFNIRNNRLETQITALEVDITRPGASLADANLPDESFARVLANPPYHDAGAGTAAAEVLKASSHQMPTEDLECWARFMARMTKPGGRVAMIHRAEVLPRILAAYSSRFGGIEVLPIHARGGEPAIRVIVEGRKGSRAPLLIRSGLILHGSGQEFLPHIDAILRHGAALPP